MIRVDPPPGTCWRYSNERVAELIADNRVWFGPEGTNVPAIKRFLTEVQDGAVPKTLWGRDEVGDNQEGKREATTFNNQEVFSTPKPERLIHRILTIATNPNDLVLDSFAGSGTTGAVAHKMNRRWIMVELGDHAHTHIIPRLRKVIDNQDPGGVTQATNWQGGGGFRYYRLAPSLLKRDKWGQWVVNPEFNPELLGESLCKLEGYRYAPSPSTFWQHGQSSENDWIYVTTATLSEPQLRELAQEVGPDRSLLVCCGAWLGNPKNYPNLTLKKIPKSVLQRCEFDRDDYSLNVAQLPVVEANPAMNAGTEPKAKGLRGKATKPSPNPGLFGEEV